MQSKLFVLLFFILIVSLTFSTNENKLRWKRKRSNINTQDIYSESKYQSILTSTENLQKNNTNFSNLLESSIVPFDLLNKLQSEKKKIMGLIFAYFNTQDDYSEITMQSILTITENIQINNTEFTDLLEIPIVPSGNLLYKLSKKIDILRHIFAYLLLFDLEELNFKCTCRNFYDLYEEFLQQEKSLLKKHLKSEKNINCPRVYFDFFQREYCSNPTRIEYSNVDYFSANLILFPKEIRRIVDFVFEKTQHRFVILKNGDLKLLKKPEDKGYFVFTPLKEAHYRFVDKCHKTRSDLFIKNYIL